MQRKNETIDYLRSQISETMQDIEDLENKIKALEDEVEMQRNLQYALEGALVEMLSLE